MLPRRPIWPDTKTSMPSRNSWCCKHYECVHLLVLFLAVLIPALRCPIALAYWKGTMCDVQVPGAMETGYYRKSSERFIRLTVPALQWRILLEISDHIGAHIADPSFRRPVQVRWRIFQQSAWNYNVHVGLSDDFFGCILCINKWLLSSIMSISFLYVCDLNWTDRYIRGRWICRVFCMKRWNIHIATSSWGLFVSQAIWNSSRKPKMLALSKPLIISDWSCISGCRIISAVWPSTSTL